MKRIIAMLLALSCVFGMCAMMASAQTTRQELVQAQTDAVSVGGDGSLGSLLSESIEDTQTDQEENTDENYVITDLYFDGNMATVEYSAFEDAVVLVAVYSEDGYQLLNSATAEASAERSVVNVIIEGDMPQYFQAAAYFVDTYDLSPLCEAFETPMYTQDVQELLASDIYDYDQDRVYNLDENTETNFLVYAPEVVVIDSVTGTNVVETADYENGRYVITNADEQITSLVPGSIFAYPYSTEELLIVKVQTIHVEGTAVTIMGTETSMDEVFDYVKLETDGDTDRMEVDTSAAAEGITYEGVVDDSQPDTRYEGGFDYSKSLKFGVKVDWGDSGSSGVSASASGSITITLKTSLSYYLTLKRQYVDICLDLSTRYALTLSGSLTSARSNILATVKVPSSIPGVTFNLLPATVFRFTATVELYATMTASFGFCYDSESGFKVNATPPTTTLGLNMEGSIFVGAEMGGSICIIHGSICELGLSNRRGVEITCKVTGSDYEYNISKTPGKVHLCEKCLAVSADWVKSASVWAKFFKYIYVEHVLYEARVHAFYMYESIEPEPSGLQMGQCPNYEQRITVQVRDSDGYIMKDWPVYVDGEKEGLTGNNGSIPIYRPKGTYTFSTTIGDTEIAVEREVAEATKVVLTSNRQILDRMNNWLDLLIKDLAVKDENIRKSGAFSSGVPWKLTRSGKLIIGDGVTQGSMGSYTAASETPWYEYRDMITAVQIQEGVTNVGAYAFAGCTKLKTAIIPDTVDPMLGKNAFSGCTGLKEIRLPVDYVVSRTYSNRADYTGAFSGCTNVEKIQYGPGSTGKMADRQTSQYSDQYYGYSLEYICRKSLKTVLFEDDVKSIGAYAFYCAKDESVLDLVYLAESITTIGSYAFYYSAAETVELEYVTNIGSYAFANSAIEEVNFSDDIQNISTHAFWGCKELKELTVPDHMGSSMGSEAFGSCTGLTTVTVPVDYLVHTSNDYAADRYSAFVGCSNVQTIYYTPGVSGKMQDRQTSEYSSNYYIYSLEYACRNSLRQVFFEEGITHIGGYAFYTTEGQTVLETLDLPTTLQIIGNNAFYNSGLQDLSALAICNQLTSIGSYAFCNSAIMDLQLPDSISSIGSCAFYGCDGLRTLTIPDHMGSNMGSEAFGYCTGLISVTVPVDYLVHTSNDYAADRYSAFVGCSNVQTIYYTVGLSGRMPDRQTSEYSSNYYIYSLEYACRNSLQQVTFEEGITSIGSYAFYCPDGDGILERAVLPTTVTSIGSYAFYKTALTQINLKNVSSVGSYTFYCSSLKKLNLPNTISSIGQYAFYGCTGLTELVIPNHLGNGMYSDAFGNCTGLKTVTVPVDYTVHVYNSYATDRYSAFRGCSNVETIYYTPGTTGRLPNRQNSQFYSNHYIHSLEYACRESLKTVTFDPGITVIGSYAFYECKVLNSITFFGDAPSISSDAFYQVTADAWYPDDNNTWTDSKLQNYGGTLTWEQFTPPQTASVEEAAPEATKTKEIKLQKTETADVVQETGAAALRTSSDKVTRHIYDGSISQDKTQETEQQVIYTAGFENLVPGQQYMMFAVLSIEQENLLAADNLLAVRQGAAGEDGMLSFQYSLRSDTESLYLLAAGPSNQNLQDAQIVFPQMYADGNVQTVEPTVTYDGKILQEELDYILLGEVDYTEAGTYTCYVRGVREYTGLVECVYTVEPPCPHTGMLTDQGDGTHSGVCELCQVQIDGPHIYEDGVCSACGNDTLRRMDLDGDGKVTAFDAQFLAEAQAGLRELTQSQWAAVADLTPQDIISYVLGKKRNRDVLQSR